MDSTTVATSASKTNATASAAGDGAQLKIEIQSLDHGGSEQFRAALQRHLEAGTGAAFPAAAGKPAGGGKSLGNVIAGRVSGLASEMQKDQQYVSKMLEQATRTGDEIQMMRAMMALSDYQLRVQTISKTVSKATTAIDSLTKLQ